MKVIAHLDPLEIELFDKVEACKQACHEIVRTVIHQWENNRTVDVALWRELVKKYNIPQESAARLRRAGDELRLLDEVEQFRETRQEVEKYISGVLGTSTDPGASTPGTTHTRSDNA